MPEGNEGTVKEKSEGCKTRRTRVYKRPWIRQACSDPEELRMAFDSSREESRSCGNIRALHRQLAKHTLTFRKGVQGEKKVPGSYY